MLPGVIQIQVNTRLVARRWDLPGMRLAPGCAWREAKSILPNIF
jgi:hypothetical protein